MRQAVSISYIAKQLNTTSHYIKKVFTIEFEKAHPRPDIEELMRLEWLERKERQRMYL